MRRLLKWLVILSVIGGVGYAVGKPSYEQWVKSRAPRFRQAPITKGRVEYVVNSTGTIKPIRQVSVGSFVSGPIAEILVDFNSVVKKGDLLAKIDPRLLEAMVERDKASLSTQIAEKQRVQALLKQASNNEDRANKLRAVNKDYMSDTEMDQFHFNKISLDAQLALAEAGILQSQAGLKNSSANLGYTEIRSPVDGIVIERKVDPGQTVASQFQIAEMFIIAPDMEKQMHCFASVDEADIGLIRDAQTRNQPVKFTVDAYPEQLFNASIHQIRKSSTTNQNVVTYPVVIEAPNPELKLLPGMTANISFQIDAKEDAIRIPVAAFRFYPPIHLVHPNDRGALEGLPPPVDDQQQQQQQQNKSISASEKARYAKNRNRRLVWVVEGDLLRAKSVLIGLMDNQFAEMKEGELKEGDSVVVSIEQFFGGATAR